MSAEPTYVEEMLDLPVLELVEPDPNDGIPPDWRILWPAWRSMDDDAQRLADRYWVRFTPAERIRLASEAVGSRQHLATTIRELGFASPAAYLETVAPAPGAAGGTLAVGKLLPDFLAESSTGVSWAIRGCAVDGALLAVLGRPESFKTMGLIHAGLALAGGPDWLGFELGARRPFIYASNEKTASTVRERFRRMTAGTPPTEPVVVMHRAGVTFGNPARWDAVVSVVAGYAAEGRPPFVALDTLASLSGPGFNENDGRDMATVLGAVRRLTDLGATVALAHHPAKHAEGSGGILMRGHSSLHGEVDGSLQFTRPDRETEGGLIRGEPKDGDLVLVRFDWDPETFLLERSESVFLLTAATLAATVAALYKGDPLPADRIRNEFPGHGRSVFAERLSEAVDAGLVLRSGRGRATVYQPAISADDTSPKGWTG